MFNNKAILKDFIQSNLSIILPYMVAIFLILPLESIAFSKYNYKIIESVKSNNLEKMKRPIILICVIYMAGKIFGLIKDCYLTKINNKLNAIIREKLFKAYVHKYTTQYEEVDISRIVSKLNLMPRVYEDVIYDFLYVVLPYGITVLVLALYFFYINKKLGGYIILLLLVMLITIVIMAKHSIIRELAKYNKYNELNDSIQDKMFNIESVIYNNEIEDEISDSMDKEGDYSQFALTSDLTLHKYSFILNIIVFVLLIGVFVIYFNMFKNGIRDEKTLASILIFFYLLKYINLTKWNLLDLLSKMGILDEANKDFQDKEIIFTGGTEKDFINNGHIIINNLAFKYNNKNVHTDLNMEFISNKITTILGKSGSGKTTILKLLMGFYPYEGNIYFDNVELRKADLGYVRDNIAMVNQNIKLFNKTIYDNIKYSNDTLTNKQIDDKLKELNITVFEDLNKKVGINGSQLSSGQRQVIMILRSYFKDKKIVIYDEPTSALDKITKQIIIDLIKLLSKNKTTIIVTHDYDLAKISDTTYNL